MAGAILIGPLLGLPYGAIPLIAVQILFVNLVTDGLPAIALSIDPPAPDLMERKPRPRGQGVFTKPVVILMVIGGIWIGIVTLWAFRWALDIGRSMAEAQGVCFLSLILIQFFNAYNFRSDKHSLLQIGFFKNKWLNIAVGSEILLMLVIFYVPFFQPLFNTVALDLQEWICVLLVSASVFPVIEGTKAVFRYRERKEQEKSAPPLMS
jgi:Ca2+-transporting ATPase